MCLVQVAAHLSLSRILTNRDMGRDMEMDMDMEMETETDMDMRTTATAATATATADQRRGQHVRLYG